MGLDYTYCSVLVLHVTQENLLNVTPENRRGNAQKPRARYKTKANTGGGGGVLTPITTACPEGCSGGGKRKSFPRVELELLFCSCCMLNLLRCVLFVPCTTYILCGLHVLVCDVIGRTKELLVLVSYPLVDLCRRSRS